MPEITFSRFTFYNRRTGREEEVKVSSQDLGPWEAGSVVLLGHPGLWDVPEDEGEYELKLYSGGMVAAAARFNVGIRPTSWGPEMEYFPAKVHDVQVVFQDGQAWAFITVGLADSCTEMQGGHLVSINGGTVNITLTAKRPRDAVCADIYRYEEEYWAIGGDKYLPDQTYIIQVNDFKTTFTRP
jgi:hypothetical protein